MRNGVEVSKRRRTRPRGIASTMLTIVSLLCTLLKPTAQHDGPAARPPKMCILCNPPCMRPSECDTNSGTCVARVITGAPPPPSVPKAPVIESKAHVDMQPDTSIGMPTTTEELLQLEMMKR